MLDRIWDVMVRWRTALVAVLFAAATALPSLLGAPEVLAVIPVEYRPYAIAVGFILMWMTRPRAAVRASDYEASVSRVKVRK